MNMEKLNEWLLLVTNVAVVAGIVFLAVEIRQNSELLESGSRQAIVSNDQASIRIALEYPEVIEAMDQDGPLSEREQLLISAIYLMDIRSREFEYFQYKNGLLDEAAWASYRRIILVNHSTPRGRIWWNKVGRLNVDEEFAKMVDDLLADAPVSEVLNLLSNWDESSH